MAVKIVVQGWLNDAWEARLDGSQLSYAHGPVGRGTRIKIVCDDPLDAKEAKMVFDKLSKAGYRSVVIKGAGKIVDEEETPEDPFR